MSAGRTGGSTCGALRVVRFLWSLTWGVMGDAHELRILRLAHDDAASLSSCEALDDGTMLRVLRDELAALGHFEVSEVEARSYRAASERVDIGAAFGQR